MECPACSAVNGFILSTIQRDLTTALEEEFPGWTIVFPEDKGSQLKTRTFK
jgi:hypothetical protein